MSRTFVWVKAASLWLAAVCAVDAGAAVYKVGSGAGCTHSTIQAAVDAAAAHDGFDYIRITRSKTYTAQAVHLSNGQVQFEGGWKSCTSPAPDYVKTTVSGAGGGASPVFDIQAGTPHVLFADLAIVSGDSSGSGGGVLFSNYYGGQLTLRNVHLSQNAARESGGGLYVRSEPNYPVEVWIDGGTLIEGNRSASVGGGVYCENANVRVNYSGTRISLNEALRGGGVYAQHCNVDVTSGAQFPFYGAVSLNRASGDGGGVYLAQNSWLYLHNTDANAPTMINANLAEGIGGGIYITGSSMVEASSTIIDGNVARNGGAGIALIDRREGALLMMYGRPANCAPNLECNRISNNTARSAAGLNQHGAAILHSVQDVSDVSDSHVYLEGVAVTGNAGATAIRGESLHGIPAPMQIAGTVFAFNTTSADLIQHVSVDPVSTSSVVLWMDGTTIAQNQVGSGVVVRSTNDLLAYNSIVWQPGARAFEPIASPFLADRIKYMLVNDTSSIPASPSVIVADPKFANAAGGDFRLNQDSPAVDFSGSIYDVTRDGRERRVDLPSVPNRYGPADLGAFERQTDTTGQVGQ